MKAILERNLDFRQFQNLIILIFIFVMVLLGMLNSLPLESYILIKILLLVFTVFLFAILFTKKGFYAEKDSFYTAIFLFGCVLKKEILLTSEYSELSLIKGKLSTNYKYSYNSKELHNWEPDLNHSGEIIWIIMINENLNLRKKILRLTKPEKVKIAIDFIVEYTNLKF